MFGSQILEVAIGLILVYLVLSLICSAIREIFEAWMKTRAAFLERGIRKLLHDPHGTALATAVYHHPQIYPLFRGGYNPSRIKRNGLMPAGSNLPSYIPAKNFALSLLDIVVRGPDPSSTQAATAGAPAISLAAVRSAVANINNPPVQRALLSAIDTATDDLDNAQANLEAWYNSGMERVSGWYKRRTQFILLGLGIGLAVAVNVNSVTIARRLYQDQALRDVLVAQAGTLTRDSLVRERPQELLTDLEGLGLPLGWTDTVFGLPGTTRTVTIERNGRQQTEEITLRWWDHFLSPLFGWSLTGLAVTLGAPFWFDLLNKFMVIRGTVKPHEKGREEKSKK